MNLGMRTRTCATLALVAVLLGCSSEGQGTATKDPVARQVIVDGPVYESVEQLAARGQLYVQGTVGEVLGSELDGGGIEPENPHASLKVEFVEIFVSESSNHSVAKPGATAVVAWEGFGDVVISGDGQAQSDLNRGSEVLMIVVAKTRSAAPGIKSFENFLVPVGGEAGVFDVEENVATARLGTLVALKDEDVEGGATTRLVVSTRAIVSVASKAWAV